MPLGGWAAAAVSHPTVNRVQTRLLGRRRLEDHLRPVAGRTAEHRTTGVVVDVGGGTARSRAMWPAGWRYVSVDPDARVTTLEDRDGAVERVVGDAADLPLPDACASVVLMQCVSHHLDDDTWPAALDEAVRVLADDGHLVFLDGVWSDRRVVSRWFWRLDAGHHPRSADHLERSIGSRFDILDVDRFTLVHHSILVTARVRR